MDWTACFFSCLGLFLNAKKKIISWWVWIVSNIIWIIYGLKTFQYPLIVLQIVNIVINFYGLKEWNKNKI